MSRGDAAARRLYAWEDREVAPRDASRVPYARLQALIDHVWAAEGLRWPPRLRPLPPQARMTVARATRLAIEAPPVLPSWILLHELAHAMTSTADGLNEGHGPRFVGLYLQLLVRHARMPEAALAASLRQAGIPFEAGARPVFLA
ncbi:SprT family zinc-dependent metalloprotease [Roseicella frigidaeris]|uniref:Uncharacterized protein n=1 Tax=Roseicella frigidaeris TaxID=2230885 RepID=A0A327MLD9_9PROT|nr:hypothetical protein [Roseicella frigidaeris]RAI60968.1 hypothetical protein DOO78_02225 [Roseicella frigidaeris]